MRALRIPQTAGTRSQEIVWKNFLPSPINSPLQRPRVLWGAIRVRKMCRLCPAVAKLGGTQFVVTALPQNEKDCAVLRPVVSLDATVRGTALQFGACHFFFVQSDSFPSLLVSRVAPLKIGLKAHLRIYFEGSCLGPVRKVIRKLFRSHFIPSLANPKDPELRVYLFRRSSSRRDAPRRTAIVMHRSASKLPRWIRSSLS